MKRWFSAGESETVLPMGPGVRRPALLGNRTREDRRSDCSRTLEHRGILWKYVQYTGYGRAMRIAVRDIYGIDTVPYNEICAFGGDA